MLARELDGLVVGVDLFPAFLERLSRRVEAEGLGDRVETLAASMEDLPFAPGSLDAIWSEGAIYNMGFAAGVAAWRPLLRPGGVLVLSELTWLTRERPTEIQQHWDEEYPEVGTAAEKLAVLEAAGYSPLGYFPLPVRCWLDNYYRPLQERVPGFVERHADSEAARAIADAEEAEISLYERHADVVSYGVYVSRRTDG